MSLVLNLPSSSCTQSSFLSSIPEHPHKLAWTIPIGHCRPSGQHRRPEGKARRSRTSAYAVKSTTTRGSIQPPYCSYSVCGKSQWYLHKIQGCMQAGLGPALLQAGQHTARNKRQGARQQPAALRFPARPHWTPAVQAHSVMCGSMQAAFRLSISLL